MCLNNKRYINYFFKFLKRTIKLFPKNLLKLEFFFHQENLENSKEIYEEIILSKNKFYSPLALNTILENNLRRNVKKFT